MAHTLRNPETMTVSTTPWWSKDTVAVVTGANKGIGYEIVRGLGAQGVTVVLTARDESRGQAAVNKLTMEGLTSIFFHQLDVSRSESVKAFALWLQGKFGFLHILVNNAGINSGRNGFNIDYENAKDIVDTNYFGVKNVTEGLLPLLQASPVGARIVNVSSRLGLYNRLRSEALKKTLKYEEKYTEELIDSLATKYLDDMKAGRLDEAGWVVGNVLAGPMYSESKMFLNAYAITLAKSLSISQPKDQQILVATYCPGVTGTDMLESGFENGWKPPVGSVVKSVADGADTGIWLALLPTEDLAKKNGRFFGEREEYLFGWENPGF